jgi:hypothetical protein
VLNSSDTAEGQPFQTTRAGPILPPSGASPTRRRANVTGGRQQRQARRHHAAPWTDTPPTSHRQQTTASEAQAGTTCDRLRARRGDTPTSPARATQSRSVAGGPPATALHMQPGGSGNSELTSAEDDFHQSRDRSGMCPPRVADLVRCDSRVPVGTAFRDAYASSSCDLGSDDRQSRDRLTRRGRFRKRSCPTPRATRPPVSRQPWRPARSSLSDRGRLPRRRMRLGTGPAARA